MVNFEMSDPERLDEINHYFRHERVFYKAGDIFGVQDDSVKNAEVEAVTIASNDQLFGNRIERYLAITTHNSYVYGGIESSTLRMDASYITDDKAPPYTPKGDIEYKVSSVRTKFSSRVVEDVPIPEGSFDLAIESVLANTEVAIETHKNRQLLRKNDRVYDTQSHYFYDAGYFEDGEATNEKETQAAHISKFNELYAYIANVTNNGEGLGIESPDLLPVRLEISEQTDSKSGTLREVVRDITIITNNAIDLQNGIQDHSLILSLGGVVDDSTNIFTASDLELQVDGVYTFFKQGYSPYWNSHIPSESNRIAVKSALVNIEQAIEVHKNSADEFTRITNALKFIEIAESKLSLDDIGGLEHVKKILREIAMSFLHPELMEKWGAKRPQAILLHGEPGTGKTMLARALANEIDAEVWTIQSTDIYEKWLGDSESHIKDIFDRARQHKGRLVIFFDEFESILSKTESPQSGGADNARNAVAGIFKQEMNTISNDNPNILIVATTNKLDGIDPALRRPGRFDHTIYVPMPDTESRQQILSNVVTKSIIRQEASKLKMFNDDLNITSLAEKTDGLSGADILEIFRRLVLSRAMQEAHTGEEQPPISQEEIEQAIRELRTQG